MHLALVLAPENQIIYFNSKIKDKTKSNTKVTTGTASPFIFIFLVATTAGAITTTPLGVPTHLLQTAEAFIGPLPKKEVNHQKRLLLYLEIRASNDGGVTFCDKSI
jgi:hypothetical protein